MSKKKPNRGCLIPLLLLMLLLAALFLLGTGGGGGRSGSEGASPLLRVEMIRKSAKTAARKIRAALSPVPKNRPKPLPAPPVPPNRLAAWSAAQRASEKTAASAAEPVGKTLLRDAEESVREPPPDIPSAAGFPGVILLRYNPPDEETGFSAVLAPAGLEPVVIAGLTSREFCERLSEHLDRLAKPPDAGYTRFYALETDRAGSSQTRWLSETVKTKFPGILYETESSTEKFEQ
ncbi:MAG: hypothetical protein IJJ20_09230 [Thermoguttaceae bacterium]|nr:hypothetical protein [Thermoguttaceae bacterium]